MAMFPQYLTHEQQETLRTTANAMVSHGKGILAADEDPVTMGDRFKPISVDNSEENRRTWKQIVLSTQGLEEYVSAVILYPDSFYYKTDDGQLLPQLLASRGIIPGINVDQGFAQLAGTNKEVTTQGLDGLAERCRQFSSAGARFAKWRCCIKIDKFEPSIQALKENANVLARYASICQQNGLVPIVEPEVAASGDHDLETAQRVSQQVLSHVYSALLAHHVFLEGTLLKPSMVTEGSGCGYVSSVEEVARATVECMERSVPCAVPGIGFLSGGQTPDSATVRLNAINMESRSRQKLTNRPQPWKLTFTYGRALQGPALEKWNGQKQNVPKAQQELLFRAKMNALASVGNFQ